MISRFARHTATTLALVIGVLGLLGVLYAWKLPPFSTTLRITEDAYVHGKVTTLAPQLAGIVAEVAVQDFQRVKAGDLLVRIDDRIYRQKLAQAEAALEVRKAARTNARQQLRTAEAELRSAESGVVYAKAALKVAEADLGRTERLIKRSIVSQREADEKRLSRDQARAALDQARAKVDTARQSVASVLNNRPSLEAAVASAEAAVKLARIDLDNTRITAPVNGRLGEVGARTGQYVSAGSRLATLVPDRIWIVANYKETQVRGMEPGQPVTFTVDALGDARLTGHIERFSPATGSEFSVISASNATGNFIKIARRLPVRIAIDPGQPLARKLSPGMSVVASIDVSDHRQTASAATGRGASALPTP